LANPEYMPPGTLLCVTTKRSVKSLRAPLQQHFLNGATFTSGRLGRSLTGLHICLVSGLETDTFLVFCCWPTSLAFLVLSHLPFYFNLIPAPSLCSFCHASGTGPSPKVMTSTFGCVWQCLPRFLEVAVTLGSTLCKCWRCTTWTKPLCRPSHSSRALWLSIAFWRVLATGSPV